MKRFLNYYLSMTLIASLFVMAGCGDDTEDPIIDSPLISFGAGAGVDDVSTVDVGETVAFDINITAPGGVNRVEVIQEGETTALIDTARASGDVPTTFTVPFSYTPTAEDAGETLTFNIRVTGEDNQEALGTYTIIVNEVAFEEYQTILLGGQLHGSEPSFYNAVANERLGYSAANSNPNEVDFIYYYVDNKTADPQPLATIGAPADPATRTTWANTTTTSGNKLPLAAEMDNVTMFKNVTTTSYADITTGGELINAFAENQNPADTRITNLQVGQTFAFMLDEDRGSRHGVVEVADIQGAFGAERTITLNVKVQAPAE